jgi:tyrosine-specific transport protein
MKKVILSACLVAGTSVGAGMIALPMALCKIGILPTIILILGVWFFMYVSGILGIELNLRAGRGLPLGKLACLYSGPIASSIGTISLILLIYALLCAYLYGGASILQSFFASHLGWSLELKSIVLVYAFLLGFLLIFPVGSVLQVNRILFTILLVFFSLLVCGLLYKIELSHLPLLDHSATNLRSWTEAIPVLFTSYGFQVIFHTLTNFCDKNPVILKRSIFWGSLIPAIVYIIWTVSTLGVLYRYAPQEYQQLLAGKLEVGQFIQVLAQTASWPLVQILASVISILAIMKSSIGVGLGLFEAWQEQFNIRRPDKSILLNIVCVTLTLVPPLIIALFVPQLFLKALSFAGMVLVIIALLLPLWLIHQPKAQQIKTFYTLVEHRGLQLVCLGFGLLVILCEMTNMLVWRG